MNPPEIVTLHTGVEVHQSVLRTTTLAVNTLAEKPENFIPLYELIQLASNPAHTLFGQTRNVLKNIGLLDADGRLHGDTAEVIRAGYVVEGFSVHAVNPLPENG